MSEQPVVRLDRFDPSRGFSRGRSKAFEALWYLAKCFLFLSPLPWPSSLKCAVLRFFGAEIGKGVKLQPRIAIHFPWRLKIGDHCWVGQRCEILNFEEVALEDHVALAHDVYIATGNHDYTDGTMPYRNAPVLIKRGSWVATRVFIGPGVTIGENCVVAAGAVVTKTTPPSTVVRGNPAEVVRDRVLKK